ncbi:hypothetical protein IX54_14165 [Paracoccus sanguinis]|nr:hypothetical protein IX54_14165 [Paracoccus sanguinis]
MHRSLFLLSFGACCLAAPALAADPSPSTQCEGDAGRCTLTLPLSIAAGKAGEQPVGAALGLQIGRSGEEPILFALAPLGTAVRPGLRVVLPGPVEVPLAVDVCFPDGCRASAPLDAAQMSALLSAPQADLQFFPFGAEAPVAAAVTLPDLRGSLTGAGVTLGN